MAKKEPTKKVKAKKTVARAVKFKETEEQKAAPKKGVHPLAVISVGFAIMGLFVFGILFGIIAVITGVVARLQIRERGKSRMLAIIGIFLGVIDVVGMALILASLR